VSPAYVELTCTHCQRDFASADAARRHIVGRKCLSDQALYERGIVKVDGVYRRTQPQPHLEGIAPVGRPPAPPSTDGLTTGNTGALRRAEGDTA
jgi:hypothetical protein